jgi:Flp pilus assembly pilin Flp/endogenous inhibitor of DNA gyrase (YacG/DUF329 family)
MRSRNFVVRRLVTRPLVRRPGRRLGRWLSPKNVARCEDGATAVEYALMVGLVAVGIITAVTTLKGKTESALFGAGQAIGGRFSTVVFDPNSSGSYPNDPAAATLGNAYGGSWTSSSYAKSNVLLRRRARLRGRVEVCRSHVLRSNDFRPINWTFADVCQRIDCGQWLSERLSGDARLAAMERDHRWTALGRTDGPTDSVAL